MYRNCDCSLLCYVVFLEFIFPLTLLRLCVSDRQLQKEVDGLADRLEQANIALKGDWSRWQDCMRADLKSAFLSASEKNIEYYEKVSLRSQK